MSYLFCIAPTTDGNGTRAATHTLTSEETVFQFLVYILAMVRSNVDKARIKVA